jgi:predicted house-cleaning noncanonical NTP pyrophosphatase (MazG superfamily)
MQYNKLVRDKIPEMLDEKNIPYEKRVADSDEYKIELINKLVEEVNEFCADGSVEELADVLEVIESLRKLPDYSSVEKVRQDKFEDRGGFEKRIILKGEK